jgi:hypothetical protein
MFAFVYGIGMTVLFFAGVTLAHADLIEQWGGKGANIQIYSDHRAYFLFDCAEGQTTEWSEDATEVQGTTRPDTFEQPLFRATTFVAELTSSHMLKLTVKVEGQKTKTFELQQNRNPELHNCELAH